MRRCFATSTETETPKKPGASNQNPAETARRKTPKQSLTSPAPKDRREAPPVSIVIAKAVKPGSVVAQKGLRINTAKIRLTITTRYTTSPANPKVELIFNSKGRVLRARILRSSGYPTVDGPVLGSLYKWTAEGEALNQAPTTRVTVTIEFR